MADVYSTKIWKQMGGGFAQDNRQVLSADGSTSAVVFIGPTWLSLSGSFGGGTVQNGSFTAATDTLFDFPLAPNTVNVNLTGATGPALVVRLQGTRGAIAS
jgi:hypothetical protein